MTVKLFSSGDWSDMPQGDTQIKIASGGLTGSDKMEALKVASPEIVDWMSKIATHPDCFYVHKLAMGGSHRYGPNRWGDGFREEVLRRDYPTFELYAKAYRNHDSKGPYYGKVAAARFREDMGCVELITEYYGSPKIAAANGGRVADLELAALQKTGSIPVSMGSNVPGDRCLPSWAMINTASGEKCVTDIQVGDMVLTHRGEYRPVTALIRTPAAGKRLLAIEACGYLQSLDVTDNHPVWVIRQSAIRGVAGHLRANPDFTPDFVDAGTVAVGDYLVRHVRPLTGARPISNELAYLLGQYLGDGNLEDTGKSNCVCLTTAVTDADIVEKIEECCSLLGLPYRVYPPKKGAVRIRVKSPVRGESVFVDLCRSFCGKTSDKYLRDAAFDWTAENALHFLGGYIDADGSWDPVRHNCRFGSVLPRLTDSIQELCLSVGIRSTGSRKDCTDDEWAASDYFYQYTIAKQDTNLLHGFACRVREVYESKKPALNILFDHGGSRYLATRVMTVSELEYTADLVYNFSVDEHETYTSFGYVVHNCVICHHWSPTRATYCTSKKEGGMCTLFGCKNGMLKVAEDGRLQHVDNPKNTFYDISMVRLGADPCASGLLLPMGKFADFADTMDGHWFMESKLAAWEPEVDVDETIQDAFTNKMIKVAYMLGDMEADLHQRPLDEIDVGLPVSSAVLLPDLHSPLFSKRAQAIKDLALARVFPDFASYAKSAGCTQVQIDEMQPFVPVTFQSLRARRQVPALIKIADFPKKLSTNFWNRLNSCNDLSLEQPTIVRRSLEGAALGKQVSLVQSAKVGSAIPELVCKFAAAKLAWLSEVQSIDLWHLSALQRRDFIKAK